MIEDAPGDEADDADDPTGQSVTDDAVVRGIEAVQAAATEVITAARAMLDVVEGLVHDPQAASVVLDAFTSIARAATRLAPTGERASSHDGRDDDGDGGVRRIPVS